MSIKIPRIAVLLTCHNRRNCTLNCLKALYLQQSRQIKMDVFLVDDGSTDGTAAAVRDNFPQVKILQGNGSLFWNRGMHLAFKESIKSGYDFYLWLNDDTYLYTGALEALFQAYDGQSSKSAETIIVGSTRDPDTKEVSYGGYKMNNKWLPFRYSLVEPLADSVTSCDTMCGNCVLIPGAVVKLIGNINPIYQHRWGDVDYGLRAKQAGCNLYVAASYVGECSFNNISNVWEHTHLPLKQRITAVNSVKGLQKEDWRSFTHFHGGTLWFLYWLSPYLKIFLSSFSFLIKEKKYSV